MRRAVMAASGGVLLALVVTLAAGRVPAGANEPAASAVPVFVVDPFWPQPLPPIMELDTTGALLRRGVAPGAHPWPDSEHGIHRNDRDHVWLAGDEARDGTISSSRTTGSSS